MNIIVLIQPSKKNFRELLIRLIPGLHNRTVSLLLRDQTSSEVHRDFVYRLLCRFQHFCLLCRHRHIRDRNSHSRLRRILVTGSLDQIQHLRGTHCTVDIDDFLKNLLQLFLTHMEIHFQLQKVLRIASVHISQILRQDLIKEESAEGGLHIAGYFLTVSRLLRHSDRDSGMKGTYFILIGKNRLVHVLKELSFSLCTGSLLCQIIDTQHHILRGHRHRAAV